MKTKLTCLAVLLALLAIVPPAEAWGPQCGYPCAPPIVPTPPQVPVMPYGGGWGGPAPWMTEPMPPPGLPFQGMLPAPNRGGGGCPFMVHPYARSPRDYFMYYDRDNNGTRP